MNGNYVSAGEKPTKIYVRWRAPIFELSCLTPKVHDKSKFLVCYDFVQFKKAIFITKIQSVNKKTLANIYLNKLIIIYIY
jgi:hypothetical protein